MVIYILLAVFPIILGCFYPDLKLEENKKKKITYYIICGAVMFAVLGLRHYKLGSADTQNYYNTMKNAIDCSSWKAYYDPDYFEKGAQFFIFLLSRVFKDPQWLLIISSLIFISSIFYFIDKNSNDIPLSITSYITLGLMLFNLQGMRQSIAMSICLFAYEQAKRKHLIRFVLLVLLATAFHQTAIVFFVVYILCRLDFSWIKVCVVLGISAVAVFLSKNIIGVANNMFDREYNNTVSSGGFVALAIYVLLFIVSVLYYKDALKGNETPLLYVLIVGMACFAMRYFGAQAAERISFYFAFSQIGALPNVIHITSKREKTHIYIIVLSLAVLLYIYRLHGSEFVPYRFFWQ